ncbi:Spermidine Putrescine ABC transporter permease component potB (TC_3.A.1.11.1) [Rhodovastum atsumiense]|nr:Spermidine Putrescine ABC transporter permease component potB (TC_3.A.1.11.1) [Rhodovastum atsumiense]
MSATAIPSLKLRLRRAERARQRRHAALILPLLVFLAFTFIIPIGTMLWHSVEDSDVARVLPRTVASLQGWRGTSLPGEPAFAALAADLEQAAREQTVPAAAKRLNYDVTGFRTLLMSTARRVRATPPAEGEAQAALLDIDPRWGEIETWGAIHRASGPLTDFYLLASLDLHRTADGAIVGTPAEQAVYIEVLLRTLEISVIVTGLCLLLGFPTAYLLASLPARQANLLMIFVLLPFWTSLLVRLCAWIVLLQGSGLVNNMLLWTGLIDAPLQMIFNRTGVYIAMTHVLLPFMILPLYSSMKAIPPAYMRAAASLGAPPLKAFLRVYLPQTLPGVGAGALLVFILCVGYYITPALIGGGGDQMISYFIAFFTNETVNWGMAAALGTVLLVVTTILAVAYARLLADRQTTGGLK